MTAPTSRRAMLGGIVALPALAAPASAAPAAPSDIVKLCDFAIEHYDWINLTAPAENWSDDRLDAENDRFWEAFDGAAGQPSATVQDMQAKARLALHQLDDLGELDDADPALLLAVAVLREIIALCA